MLTVEEFEWRCTFITLVFAVSQGSTPNTNITSGGVSLPASCLQLINGQLMVPAQLREFQTPNGPVMFAVVQPSLNGLQLGSAVPSAASPPVQILPARTISPKQNGLAKLQTEPTSDFTADAYVFTSYFFHFTIRVLDALSSGNTSRKNIERHQ